jgi:hypothetical protein
MQALACGLGFVALAHKGAMVSEAVKLKTGLLSSHLRTLEINTFRYKEERFLLALKDYGKLSRSMFDEVVFECSLSITQMEMTL